MKKINLIIFLFLISCGYTPINKLIDKNYSISEFEINGNNQVNTIIRKDFIKYKDTNFEKQFQIKLSSQIVKATNSKNEAGTNSNLSIKIIVDLEILENNSSIKNLNFVELINYNSLDNKFELKQYEKILIKNLTNKILEKIHLNLSTIQ
tara:strand:+ start:500 stop:949 length:450 start_codon:yes stop_codon:yes gene_type:complete